MKEEHTKKRSGIKEIELIDESGEKIVDIVGITTLNGEFIIATKDGIYKIPKEELN